MPWCECGVSVVWCVGLVWRLQAQRPGSSNRLSPNRQNSNHSAGGFGRTVYIAMSYSSSTRNIVLPMYENTNSSNRPASVLNSVCDTAGHPAGDEFEGLA